MKYSGSEGELYWDKYWEGRRVDNIKKATNVLTVRNTLSLLNGERTFGESAKGAIKLLDLGCGSGEISILLSKMTGYEVVAGDISSRALEKARCLADSSQDIQLLNLDVYALPFHDNTFDVVVSYGYASAGSYKQAQREMSRVLAPGGIAIIDFRNISLYELLRPLKLINHYRRYIRKNPKIYYFGKRGIREEFEKAGLDLQGTRDFNTFPPVSRLIPHQVYVFFENTVGRLFRPLLSRVYLAKFIRRM